DRDRVSADQSYMVSIMGEGFGKFCPNRPSCAEYGLHNSVKRSCKYKHDSSQPISVLVKSVVDDPSVFSLTDPAPFLHAPGENVPPCLFYGENDQRYVLHIHQMYT